jgi:hypothetical protein
MDALGSAAGALPATNEGFQMNLRMIPVTALACTLLPLMALAGDPPNIAGTWHASFDTQIGKQEYTYTFAVSGAQLTGHAKSASGDVEITEGKVDGNKVSFVENLNYQGMPLRISYTGTIVSASQIDFSRDVAGVAQEKLTASRSK